MRPRRLQVEKSPEAIALCLATLQVGAIFLPRNTTYTGAEVDYYIGDAAHSHRAIKAMVVKNAGGQGRGQPDGTRRASTANMLLFISGSAPLLAKEHRTFTNCTGHATLGRYGMTETCMIASNRYEGAQIAGAAGMALPGLTLRITDRETGAKPGRNCRRLKSV